MSRKQRITPERLAGDPSLLGTVPVDITIAPGGDFALFRGPDVSARERFNLYQINLSSQVQSLWLDSNRLSPTSGDVTALSAEERAQRERRRDFSHGISSYAWRPEHNEVLAIVDGQAYLVAGEDQQQIRSVCPDNTRQLGFTWSTRGRYLSYVRARDLYFITIPDIGKTTGKVETRVTDDASEILQSGLPDFLAAEEMHRFTGHWWSVDETVLYYTRTDENPVELSYRLEIDANGARTVPQRYPYAGKANPEVELWAYDLASERKHCIFRSQDNDEYLARAYPVEAGLLLLIQDRAQQVLSYLFVPQGQAMESATCLYTERSKTWVNLTDDFIATQSRFYITDETRGTRQLLSFNMQGQVLRHETIEHVNGIIHADDERVLISGWQDNPTENHLFEFDIELNRVQKLTHQQGWHQVTCSPDGTAYIDHFTSSASLRSIDYVRRVYPPDGSRAAHTEVEEIYRQDEDPDHPYIPYLESHKPGEISYLETGERERLWYRVTPPVELEANKNYPVILYVYGGPGAQKVRNEWNPPINQLFAHNGFGVIELDNRGSANRGRAFEAPLYRSMGNIEVSDQLKVLDVLKQLSWVDMSRLGVFGHSYGGYMSLMLLCQAPQTFAAGVAVAPVCDWRLYDTHYTERFMGTPANNEAGYSQGNVLTHLPALSSPLLLMHGMADDNVLFTNSTMIMAELQRLNKPFDLMTYPGAKHSMQEKEVAIHRFHKILSFFTRELSTEQRL